MKKCIVFLHITIILLLFSNLCYSSNNYNYAYYYNIDSKYFYIIELTTNKITNIDLINIIPNDENIDYVSEIESDYESDYQVFSIKTEKKNSFWFIVNKYDTTKNYITRCLSQEKNYGYKILFFNNYIFYPKYNKNNDFCLFNLINKKETIINNYQKSILNLSSLPKSMQNSIEETRKKLFYDYDTRKTSNYIFSNGKLYFTVQYYLGGGGVGRQPNLQYVRLVSINTKNNICKIEKENFYTTESALMILNNTALIFTKDKIIEYNLITNSANEYNHKLDLISPQDPFGRTVDIFPLLYENNKVYFITNDIFESPEKRQLISFDFKKANILFEKKDSSFFIDAFYINDNFIIVGQHKNESDLVIEQINKNGKVAANLKTKGTSPYEVICCKNNKLYFTAYTNPDYFLFVYDSSQKKIINKINLDHLE